MNEKEAYKALVILIIQQIMQFQDSVIVRWDWDTLNRKSIVIWKNKT